MRILIISPIFPPEIGGPATYVPSLAKHLVDLGHQVTVVAFCSLHNTHAYPYSLRLIPTSGTSIFRQLKMFFSLLRSSHKVDAIYVQGTLVVGLTAVIVSFLKHRPYYVKFVGDEVWEANQRQGGKTTLEQFYKQISKSLPLVIHRLVLKRSAGIVVPSFYLKHFLTKAHQIQSTKITVIDNPVEISTQITNNHQPKRLLYIGRLVPWKQVDQVIHAFSLAVKKDNQYTLEIIGDGPEKKKLQDLTKQLNVDSKIVFRGTLSSGQTHQALLKAEKVILYSLYEGQSHTLLEAMLSQTAVIASDIPPNRELVKACGQLVKLNDLHALSKAMVQSIDKKQLQNCAQQKASRHSWANHLTKLLNLISL